MGESLLDTGDVALRLKVPLETVRSWRYTGRGPRFFKVGRSVRYRPEDVERWLTENAVTPSGDAA
jgi:predicted DNA-binding transcriptional regulator AlpA